MAEFDLNEYKCANCLRYLWRVIYPGSQSQRDPTTGSIFAADRIRTFSDESELKDAIIEHIDWYSREPSCFISTFDDEQHARHWARRLYDRGEENIEIHKISTTLLPLGALLLHMTSLTARLHIHHPHADHEVLVMHCIPSRSIMRTTNLGEAFFRRNMNSISETFNDVISLQDEPSDIKEKNDVSSTDISEIRQELSKLSIAVHDFAAALAKGTESIRKELERPRSGCLLLDTESSEYKRTTVVSGADVEPVISSETTQAKLERTEMSTKAVPLGDVKCPDTIPKEQVTTTLTVEMRVNDESTSIPASPSK